MAFFLLFIGLYIAILIPLQSHPLIFLSHTLFLSHSIHLCFVCLKKMGSLEAERKVTGWAARDPSGVLSPYTYNLR